MTDVTLAPNQTVSFLEALLKRPVVESVFVELAPAGEVERVGRAARVHELLNAK
jgi:hypothetical protein